MSNLVPIEEVGKFFHWTKENRWFNYKPETDEWSYTFMWGTAMSQEEYRKNYIKTTPELYELFKKDLVKQK